MVPYKQIREEKYDLSFSRYHEEVFEEIKYEKPDAILKRLIASEVGEDTQDTTLKRVKGGIVKELLELRGMIG
jgi:type I restriction enzyme M protein